MKLIKQFIHGGYQFDILLQLDQLDPLNIDKNQYPKFSSFLSSTPYWNESFSKSDFYSKIDFILADNNYFRAKRVLSKHIDDIYNYNTGKFYDIKTFIEIDFIAIEDYNTESKINIDSINLNLIN
jgi:hypothetical protein